MQTYEIAEVEDMTRFIALGQANDRSDTHGAFINEVSELRR